MGEFAEIEAILRGAYNLSGPPGQVRKSRWKAWLTHSSTQQLMKDVCSEATTRSGCTWGRRLKNLHPEVLHAAYVDWHQLILEAENRSAHTSHKQVEHG